MCGNVRATSSGLECMCVSWPGGCFAVVSNQAARRAPGGPRGFCFAGLEFARAQGVVFRH